MSKNEPITSSVRTPPNRLGDSIAALCQRLDRIYWQEWDAMMMGCPEPVRPMFQDCGLRLRERLLDKSISMVHEAEILMQGAASAGEHL